MPSHRYPFVLIDYGQKMPARELPVVPIRLRNPHTKIEQDLYALVDTGADHCVISSDLAKSFRHRICARGVKIDASIGIAGQRCKTYKHTFEIELLSQDRSRILWQSGPVLIGCASSGTPPIPGFECFLKNFRLTVDSPKKYLQLTW